MAGWTREVNVTPAYDWLKEPGGYGIHNCEIEFVLKGERGHIYLQLGTEWFMRKTWPWLDECAKRNGGLREGREPKGYYLGMHAPAPHYEGQSIAHSKCDVFGGKPCYIEGTYSGADAFIAGLVAGGTDWLWPKLEAVYASWFEGAEWPDLTPPVQVHPDERRKARASLSKARGEA